MTYGCHIASLRHTLVTRTGLTIFHLQTASIHPLGPGLLMLLSSCINSPYSSFSKPTPLCAPWAPWYHVTLKRQHFNMVPSFNNPHLCLSDSLLDVPRLFTISFPKVSTCADVWRFFILCMWMLLHAQWNIAVSFTVDFLWLDLTTLLKSLIRIFLFSLVCPWWWWWWWVSTVSNEKLLAAFRCKLKPICLKDSSVEHKAVAQFQTKEHS